jgi:hypothetical protein
MFPELLHLEREQHHQKQAELGKVTLKSDGDEALSDESP